MSWISSLKAVGAQMADLYSKQACPWDKFDRPFLPKTLRPLYTREAECWDDLQAFWFYDELLVNRIPMDRVPPALDTGDQATWQGIYAAMVAYKYARAKSDVLQASITRLLKGMVQHQTFHKEPAPRLIRGYDRTQKTRVWQDDASNDTLTGHFAGLYFILRFGPIEQRLLALELLANISRELIENKMCLIRADRTPTTYGKIINGVLTEPLQMTLALAILTVADHYGLHPQAARMRDEVYTKYAPMIPYPKTVLGTLENWNDDHRAALHLSILALEDKSPRMQELVQQGLLRLWGLLKNRGNVWVNGLLALGMGDTIQHDVATEMRRQALLVLGEYELEDKRFDLQTDWSGTFDGHTYPGQTVLSCEGVAWRPRIISINSNPRSTQPMPHWCCSSQDFIYQRHRYSCRDWLGNTRPSQRFNGGDFLAAYHVNVLAGILTPQD